jgi:SAM-dependent methyltransferase
MMLFWLFAAVVLLFGFVVFRGAPYVPSHRKDVAKAFGQLYEVGEKDIVVDVGSGDGIILRMAARRGARAVGYELNPALVMISRFLSRRNKKITVHLSDFWFVKLPAETTLVYVFAVERDVKKLAAKFQAEADRLGRPFHVISYGSELPSPPQLKTIGAHHLYIFRPLHEVKP